jgi:Plasmid pRiA4b ORF-3-like protein
MARWVSKGKCNLCGETFSKAGMTKHLATCRQSHALKKLEGHGNLRKTNLFHLVVEGGPAYWMHLEAPDDATLKDLDQFLRDIWLECCGHLSAFTIAGTRYDVDASTAREWGDLDTRSMNVPLAEVLGPGIKCDYEYDFGTTTELTLKVVAERKGQARGKAVQVLARNDPPPIMCNVCGKPATQVCANCIWSGEGWLCDECAPDHPCGEEMMLPVVNSPRVGMCGYTGPLD